MRERMIIRMSGLDNSKETQWEGYRQLQFTVGGRSSLVVFPEHALPGKPWVWRTEFFGAFDMADRDLLRQGWHVAYHQVSNLYGCPLSILWLHDFYEKVTGELGLAKKAALFGFSRGGLYAREYAAAYPEETLCLYLDAPVVDVCSWPGGMGQGVGEPHCWRECLACFQMTEAEAAASRMDCLKGLDAIAKADIPIIMVAGDADDTVPYEENGLLLKRRYEEKGGRIQVILKPGIGHHPHSLEDPAPIVDFIKQTWEETSL